MEMLILILQIVFFIFWLYLAIFKKMKNPIQIMVWVGLTSKGATKPYFVNPKETVDSEYYTKKILPHAKREGLRIFKTDKWVLFVDSFK